MKGFSIMKKEYIIPQTEVIAFSTQELMQGVSASVPKPIVPAPRQTSTPIYGD